MIREIEETFLTLQIQELVTMLQMILMLVFKNKEKEKENKEKKNKEKKNKKKKNKETKQLKMTQTHLLQN